MSGSAVGYVIEPFNSKQSVKLIQYVNIIGSNTNAIDSSEEVSESIGYYGKFTLVPYRSRLTR